MKNQKLKQKKKDNIELFTGKATISALLNEQDDKKKR